MLLSVFSTALEWSDAAARRVDCVSAGEGKKPKVNAIAAVA